MLNFTEAMSAVILGVFIVSSPSLNARFNGGGGSTAIPDTKTNLPVSSCDSLGAGLGVRCQGDHAQLIGGQGSSSVPEDSAWLNPVVMGPDPGGKAAKESVDQGRSDAKPTPGTSLEPTPDQTPGEEEKGKKPPANSLLQEDCDTQLGTVRTHCLLYLALRAK